jgi:nucleoporin NUP82
MFSLVPEAYIRSLSAFASSKLSYISSLAPSSPSIQPALKSPGRSTPGPSLLSTRYQAQTTFLSLLLAQVSANPTSMQVDDSSEPVLVHPPTSSGSRKPLVQGPFLFQPAPRELDGEDVERATDIFLLGGGSTAGSSEEDDEDAKGGRKSEFAVLGIVFEDGKVDLCLEVEKMEALWVGRQVGCSSTSGFLCCKY